MTNEIIDARGLKCPLPVLKLEKRLQALAPGAHLLILATDAMAKVDIALYCRQNGHACSLETEAGTLRFSIIKAG